jgi:CBS domain-containing protein
VKVREVMGQPAVFCTLTMPLSAAIELMAKNECGFLPVVGDGGNVVGVITDRDICIALGTRNQKPADVLVKDVVLPKEYTFPKLFTCTLEDEIHSVLKTMRIERIHRLPVVSSEGSLLGILSIDDVVLHACSSAGKNDISCKDVVDTLKAICAQPDNFDATHQPAA